MRKFVDLHTHSSASDGSDSPTELIRLADQQKLCAIALADHDTLDGIEEAQKEAEKFKYLTFIPGIEVSASTKLGAVHILGLGINPKSKSIRELADFLRNSRHDRNPKIIKKLQGLGFDISMDDVMQVARESHADDYGPVSRTHIAEALRRKKIVPTLTDAFHKLVGHGCIAYADRNRLNAKDTIRAIRDSGGLACIAHPGLLNVQNRLELETFIRSLVRHGLDGIETYHCNHDAITTRLCLDIAKKLNLKITGGSDYHGKGKPTVKLGFPRVPKDVVTEELIKKLSRCD